MATIALFIARLLEIYSFIIWIRIMLSWINPFPMPGSFTYYLAAIVDPYLNMFRSSRFRAGMLDFSPLIGIGLLTVAQSVFQIYGTYGMMTLSLIIMLFLQAFWSYGVQIFFTIGIIILILKTIASFMSGSQFSYAMSRVQGFFTPIENSIRRTFFKRSIPKQTTINIIMLIFTIALYFIVKTAFSYLMMAAARIPL